MSSPPAFRTAIVPAAGLGTRFLPTTKAVPKELLPVVDTPGIELVATEAAEAGADRLVIVTSPDKQAVTDYFQDSPDLERTLAERGKDALLEKVRRAPGLIAAETAVQDNALGLGHAVSCAEPNLREIYTLSLHDALPICHAEPNLRADDDAVAVLLPDDLVLPRGVLKKMAEVRARHGGSVLCAFDVPREQVSSYGVFEVAETSDEDVKQVRGMVEKPAPEDAPSSFAAAGRYLLDRAVFDALKRIEPGAGGELQLTDAVALLISEGHPVHVVVHRGGRHDLGNPGGFLKAAVDFALEDSEYGPGLRDWLVERLNRS